MFNLPILRPPLRPPRICATLGRRRALEVRRLVAALGIWARSLRARESAAGARQAFGLADQIEELPAIAGGVRSLGRLGDLQHGVVADRPLVRRLAQQHAE